MIAPPKPALAWWGAAALAVILGVVTGCAGAVHQSDPNDTIRRDIHDAERHINALDYRHNADRHINALDYRDARRPRRPGRTRWHGQGG